jgi:hypothetical protein
MERESKPIYLGKEIENPYSQSHYAHDALVPTRCRVGSDLLSTRHSDKGIVPTQIG